MKKIITKKLIAIISILMLLPMIFIGSACGGSQFDKNKNISVVTREDGSGTKSAFMEIIGLKGKADISGIIVATSTQAVLTEVRSNPLAIAYDSLGYVTSDVKKLNVDGVEPTVENIKSGAYSISRPLSVVYNESSMNDLKNAYFAFLQSEDAQNIISDNGYVTKVDSAEKYVKRNVSGSLTITGSTSLKPLMEKLASAFETIETGASVSVGGGGSGTGYNDANNGVSDFGMISETFVQSKAEKCTSMTVALDGIAVIVNTKNPLNNITKEQLKNIYNVEAGSSQIKVWKQILGD